MLCPGGDNGRTTGSQQHNQLPTAINHLFPDAFSFQPALWVLMEDLAALLVDTCPVQHAVSQHTPPARSRNVTELLKYHLMTEQGISNTSKGDFTREGSEETLQQPPSSA